MINLKTISITVAIAAFFVLCFCLLVQSQRLDAANAKASGLEIEANSAVTVTNNALRTMAIMNTVTEANNNAKQQITLESQRAENDIKVAVTGDDCADRYIPDDAVKRLRKYADSLRHSASSTTPGKPDRRNTAAAHTSTDELGK